jgi:hypothetical protein
MKTLIGLFFFVILIVSFGCKKDPGVNFHYDYYPVNEGHFVIYQVTDIHIDAAVNQYDTTEFYIKALIGDTFVDNEGRVTRRYERYFGPSSNGPWVLNDIWTTLINGNKAELVEENNRTIKMVFSPTKYQEWDANAYNTMGEADCYYTDIHKSTAIGGLSFDSTVTVVEQAYDINLIEHKEKYEKYSKGVGMIKKVFVDCSINNFDTLQIQSGRKLYMNVVDFGNE